MIGRICVSLMGVVHLFALPLLWFLFQPVSLIRTTTASNMSSYNMEPFKGQHLNPAPLLSSVLPTSTSLPSCFSDK
ncbi:hypothetical protein GBAR_LOCUS2693 [Geodia barretti]|uniref:Uncharacterized protein n=1 Tax=Geodia barretti TaxID=519541 RepID=A0AA35VZ94_GEOBA|nr:hypothetical protein GBAR_LOCUS2693 [Geodia barretti]